MEAEEQEALADNDRRVVMSNFDDSGNMRRECKVFREMPGQFLLCLFSVRDPGIMPARCPSCGKELKDHTSVARHMSQPRSGCNTWLEDLIRLNSILPPSNDAMVTDDSYETEDMAYDFNNGESFERESGSRTQDRDAEVTDFFPEPPLAFEHGYTFLSLFESDENSVHRKTNLYYPFSSRREWQVAAWLLRSGLSMGQIDSFLALEMVRALFLMLSRSFELMAHA